MSRVAVLAPWEDRDVLPGQDQSRPAGRCGEDGLPGGGGLVGVGGPHHVEPRDRAQCGEVLDRLVGRAVLAEADGVVGPDVGDREPHQRRQPDRRAHVVGEGQERGAEDAGAAVDGDAVEDRAHGVLADAEVEHPSRERVCLPHAGGAARRGERRGALDRGVVGLGEVGRSTPQLGHFAGDRVEDLRRTPCGWPRPSRRPGSWAGRSPSPPGRVLVRSRSKRAGSADGLRGPRLVALLPLGLCLLATLDGQAGVLEDLGSDLEGEVGVEAQDPLGGRDLVLTEGRAVGLAGVLSVRRRPGDDRAQHDQARLVGRPARPSAAHGGAPARPPRSDVPPLVQSTTWTCQP